jgi:hypothetical protein
MRNFELSLKRYDDLKSELGTGDLPEYHILSPEWLKVGTRKCKRPDTLEPRFLWWHGGIGSYRTLDIFRDRVLPAFSGSADLVVYLRKKEATQLVGYRVRNGKVSSHKIRLSFEDLA